MPEKAYGPTRAGSVMLELGDSIGALILETPAAMNGREIEISRATGGAPVPHTHSQVRERNTAAGTSYAAVYVGLPAGDYAVWQDPDTPAGRVTIRGGEITHFSLLAAAGDSQQR